MRDRPNLLFVFTDEQAIHTMAAYGNEQIETPNLNRLAQQSVVFDRAYVTQPVCTPSRASLLTGLYPHTNRCTENNVTLPADVRCLPELGDFSGYRVGYHGKWHLGNEIFAQHGYREFRSIDDGYREYYTPGHDRRQHSTYHRFLLDNGVQPNQRAKDGFETFGRGFACRLPEHLSKPAYLANEACRFIEQNRDVPFTLTVNFFEPHMPYFSCRDDQYRPADMPLPPNYSHRLDESNPLKTRLFAQAYEEQGHSGLPLKTDDDWRRMIANYWGLNSLVDTHLGRILDTLSEAGLEDDTIVIFTSDHGDMMGSHRLIAKCVQFEEASRVPLLVRIPGLAEDGRHVSEPVSQVDLVPTILDAMGQAPFAPLEGYSWLPFLREEAPLTEPNVFIEWNGLNNGLGDVLGDASIVDSWRDVACEQEILTALGDPVRTVVTPEGWKYNWSTLGEDELYHLVEDPFETRNLAGAPDQAGRISALRDLIRAWQARTGDHTPHQ